MYCIAFRKLLSPMYLIYDASAYILVYCGGTKISFSIFIFLSTYYKYENYEKILNLINFIIGSPPASGALVINCD